MEILQLPILALQERIEQEMLSNPVLEYEESGQSDSPAPESAVGQTEVVEGEKSLYIKEDNNKREEFERLGNVDSDYEDYLSRSSYVQSRRAGNEPDRKLEAMQNTAAPGQSLNEYMHDQWMFVECDPMLKRAGGLIVDAIDAAGYLGVELETLRNNAREEITLEQMEEALRLVQTLEPIGVGARNLPECMVVQLRNSGEDRSFEMELIEHHLKDIEMNRYPVIARKMGRSMAEIQAAIKVISRLDPRPGLQISRDDTPHIIPDIIVEYDEENDAYEARLTDGSMPALKVSQMYRDMIKKGQLPSDAKEFLQNNVRSAKWLIESIEQRRATLLRVVNHVLKTQREFMESGPLHLKPLPMVDVAQELGIHVGTVSRAVAGKYIQMPNGIHPLRYFFCGGTETAKGDSISWDAVKAKLEEVINNEDKSKPFSDDDLVIEMQKHGLQLARRTVAKYRSLLNIPPARRRKEYK
jgi:RNA polymerase sigma-54 factor